MRRCGDVFVDSRAQSGKVEKDEHQNEDNHEFSGKLREQSFSLALHTRKFSEELYYEPLAL